MGRDDAGTHERAHGPDVRRQVIGGGIHEVVEKPGADQRAERGLIQLDATFDKVDRGHVALSVPADVVADDEATVGPADEDAPLKVQRFDHGRQVVGPQRGVGVVGSVERSVRHAVPAQVVGDEPELIGERAVVLMGPAQMVLRPTVDQHYRLPVETSPLAHVQPQPAASPNLVPGGAGPCRCVHCGSSSCSWTASMMGSGGALAHRADDLIRVRSVTYSSTGPGMCARLSVMGTRRSGVFVGREREFADVVHCLDLRRHGPRSDRGRHGRRRHRQDATDGRGRRSGQHQGL